MTDDRLTQPGPDPALGDIHLASRNDTPPIARSIAVLGTGKMGSAIAARLSEAGFQVVLWNRTRSRAGPRLRQGRRHARGRRKRGRHRHQQPDRSRGRAGRLPRARWRAERRDRQALRGDEHRRARVYVEDLAAQVAAAGAPRRRADHPDPRLSSGRRGRDPGQRHRRGRRRGQPGAERARNGAPRRATGQRRAAQARGQQHARRRHRGGGELQVAGEGAGLDPADVFWVLCSASCPRSSAAGVFL